MVQCVNDESDVFAHVTINIVRFGEELRRLIDQVCGEDTANDAILIRFVEFLHAVGEQAEGAAEDDPGRDPV